MSLLKVAGTTASSGTLYVNDVFSVYLYTGNGSTQTITNGIDLAGKGGLVWIKGRTDSINTHVLQDTINGNNYLSSDTTNPAQINYNNVTAFNSAGFSIGAASRVNSGGVNFASWTFRKAAKFFDVVTYTGTGSARTIAHSLGAAPGMVIVKRTDTTGDWQVYSNGLTSAAYSIQLNLTAAQASAPTVWDSTAPTSSVFSVGTDATVNASGGTYVAYLFAHDTDADGIIQCGSFTTDGSGNATVNLGWEPQWIIQKRIDGAGGNWSMEDTMRGWTASALNERLYANTSDAADPYSSEGGKLNATGFSLQQNASATYIYMAIRMPNKPPTSGTQVFVPSTRAGTGATATTTNLTFPLDMVWSKGRDNGGTNSGDFDRLRGATYQLSLNQTDSETTASTSLTGFDVMKGYIAGSDAVQLTINATGYNYINWNFTRAPGFFDEVCWTRTTTVATLNHNLTVVPQLIIKKDRSKAGTYWDVMINVSPYDYRYDIYLNDTQAISGPSGGIYWNAAPTATTFDVNMNYDGSSNGDTFVAYLFATLAGIQYINSYVGDGTTGRVINCGFSAGARFICIKATSTTGSWWVWDSARGITSGNDPALQLNSTAAEITSADAIDPSSSGFIVNQEATCSINASGVSYLVWAIA